MQAAASPENMQDVGGAFGREWLEGRTAGGPEPTEEDDLFSWAEGPKGNPSASGYAANEPSRDWLDAEMLSARRIILRTDLSTPCRTYHRMTVPEMRSALS